MAYLYYKYIFCGLILFGYVSISKGATTVTKGDVDTDSILNYDEYQAEIGEDITENTNVTDKSPVINNSHSNSPVIDYSHSAAQLLNKFQKQHSKIGADVHLKCPVKNFGTGNILMWYKGKSKDNNLLSNNKELIAKECCKLDFDKQTLILLHANVNDTGSYECHILPQDFVHTIELTIDDSNSGTLIHVKFELILIAFSLLVFLRIFNQ